MLMSINFEPFFNKLKNYVKNRNSNTIPIEKQI